MLCEIESLGRSISAKPNVVTFGVNYDGVFTREAQSFMHRLAKIKYPAVKGCQNYLVTRSNWIDHWVKAIQSGLVDTLAKGMAQSYTDLAAQHAVARVVTFPSFTPPPVPQGVPRFTSRGIAHPRNEAFIPYSQPEVTFIEGSDQFEMVDMNNGDRSPTILPVFSGIQRRDGMPEYQWRNPQVTPSRGPRNGVQLVQTVKETEEYESTQKGSAANVDMRSVDLIRLSDESENDDSRVSVDDSLDQETSPSLFSLSHHTGSISSNGESSQSIIPHSDEQEPSITPHSAEHDFRLTEINPMNGDEVEVHLRREKNGRLVTSVGRVEHIDPDRPNRVRLEGYTNYREVMRIITPNSMPMISNDTHSQSEYSSSQYY